MLKRMIFSTNIFHVRPLVVHLSIDRISIHLQVNNTLPTYTICNMQSLCNAVPTPFKARRI